LAAISKTNNKNNKKDCFILCTGPSLLDINEIEKEYIRSCPHVCVNRYPIFWQYLNIKPKDYILLDTYNIRPIIRSVVHNNNSLNIITCSENKEIFQSEINSIKSNFIAKYTIFNKDRNRKRFIDEINERESLFWSSILGSAVNFYTIKYPERNIKILGMDGGLSSHFWTGLTPDKNLDHSYCSKNHNSMQMLKWGLPIINKECKKRSISVYSCSSNSYWCKNGYIDYSRVIP